MQGSFRSSKIDFKSILMHIADSGGIKSLPPDNQNGTSNGNIFILVDASRKYVNERNKS